MNIRTLVTILAALFVFSCSRPMESRLSIDGQEQRVDTRVAVVYAAAVAAVTLVDAAETYYLDSKPRFTDEELNASAERVALIRSSRELLDRAKEHLGSGSRVELKQLLADVRTILKLGQAAGVKVDPKIAAALAAVEGFVQ